MKNTLYFKLEYWWWRLCLMLARPFVKPSAHRRVLIIPCEPWTVIGSRGDEAMVTAIVEAERRIDPQAEIVFLSGRPSFEGLERFPNARSVLGWCGRNTLLHILRVMRLEAPHVVYALGADCMDGKYSVRVSQNLVASVAYASACGAEAHLTGFSFNDHPSPCLRKVFRVASRWLTFNLRDAVSAQRFECFTRVKPRVVADVAFLMSPQASSITEKWADWCQQARIAGNVVVGINLNPMIIKTAEQLSVIATALINLLKNAQVSLLLIPHDYRDGGDLLCLKALYEKLKGYPRVALVGDILSAPELKALVGAVDALFTCRMHLAIAALGRGKPISGFAYQGKFEGLLRHFDLPNDLIGEATHPEALSKILQQLIANRDQLTQQVALHLPQVLQLAAHNVRNLERSV